MKTFRWFAAGAAVVLLSALALWRTQSPPRPATPPLSPTAPVVSTERAPMPGAPTAPAAPVATPNIATASPAQQLSVPVVATDAIAAFENWAQQFIKADPAQRPALLSQAETLAMARGEEMARLIRDNPEQALARALPYGVRKQLPETVAALIEQPLSTRGEVRPHINHTAEVSTHDHEFCRVDGLEIEVLNGKKKRTYRAFAADKRESSPRRNGVYLHGITAGKVAALRFQAARVIDDREEIADLAAAGKVKQAGKCAFCGKPVGAAATVLEFGEQHFAYCQPTHAAEFNSQLTAAASAIPAFPEVAAAGVAGNPPDQLPPELPDFFQQGVKRLLYIRVTYADDPIVPQSDDGARATAEGNNRFFNRGSYNTVWWETTITPVVRLPQPKVYYGESGALISDALAGAAALGYFSSDYYMYYVLTTSMPQFKFGGISSGILNASPGALSHELGHNFGLPHANFWQPEGRKPGPTNNTPFPIDPDSLLGHNDINAPLGVGAAPTSLGDPTAEPVYEYGHPYDTMGGGGQFNTYFKAMILNWLPTNYVVTTSKSITNRLYAFDVPHLTGGRRYAMAIPKNNETTYWLSHRQEVTDNPWFSSGLEIMWNRSTVLIDTTPGSAYHRNDAALVVGRTFHDSQANLHITPIAKSDSLDPSNKWIDVVVQIGDFPTNQTPTLSISADTLTVSNGATVTFNALAQDSDGDLLAYYWDFGDHTFGTNGAAQSKTFDTDGVYVVRCEVSDMKGGVASRHVVVRVGEANVYTISGRVTDLVGNGVQGVRVHNSRPRLNGGSINLDSYRYSYTDSDGYYVIGNVAPGTYTNRAWLYGYKIVPANFTDPLVVTDGDTLGFNFTATPITRVKIASTKDATEPGAELSAEDEGEFIVTREGDLSEDLVVRFQPLNGFSAANVVSDEANIIWDQGRIVMPAGLSSVKLRYIPQDNAVGDGNSTAGLRLLLATNDIRIVTVLTNVVTTNQGVQVTNTMFVTRTNRLSIPGWELRPSGPEGDATWFQTDPTYVLGLAEASIEVIDDDPPAIPNVSVVAIDSYAMESNGDNIALLFQRFGAPITNDLTVYYALSGVASNGLDFTELNGVITIPAGESGAVAYISAVNDLFVEGNELATISILPDPNGLYNGGGGAGFMIVDDDLPLVNVFASTSRAFRGGGNGRITFSRAGTLDEDLTVNYLVTGTAVPGADYTALAGTVVIPAGQLSVDVAVVPNDSATTPLPRTVSVQISDSTTYNIYSDNAATVTILDGALPTLTLTGGADIGESGGNTSFTVTRTGPTTNNLNVFFDVGGTAWEGVDYSAIGTNVVIPAGSATATISLQAINDTAREVGRVLGAESIIISLRSSTNYVLSSTNSRSIRINDDEVSTALPAVGFIIGSSTVREDDGAALIYVRVTANPATNRPVQVDYRVTAGSAVPGVNYLPAFERGATGVLNFIHVEAADPPSIIGEVEGSLAQITVPILNDGVVNGNKTLTLLLMNPNGYETNVSFVTNAGPPQVIVSNVVITRIPTNAYLGPSLTHTLTILDVGTSIVTIEPSTTVAYEATAQNVRFTITRTGSTNTALTVPFALRGPGANGSDYTLSTNGSITIPAGTNSVVLTLTPRNDPTEEMAEYMTVTLLERPGYALGSPSSATVLLVSDDGTIQFLLENYNVSEADGVASIPVVRSGNTNIVVSVSFVISNITATAGSDYVITNGTLTFEAGETLKSFDVALANDSTVEPNETVAMALFNPSGGVPLGGQKEATLTIVNDDTDFSFSVTTFRGNENGTTGLVDIVRLGLATNAQSVTLTASADTASSGDFVATNVVVNFAPGQTNATIAIGLVDDILFEGNENIALQLSSPTGGAGIGPVGTGTLVIVDDEFRVDFDAPRYFAREYSNSATVVVRRVGGTVNPFTITLTTADGTAATNDYLGGTVVVTFAGDRIEADTNGTGLLTFVPGDTVKEIAITLIDDVEGEGNEDFTATLSDLQVQNALPGSAELGSNVTAIVTIIDNETAGNVDYEYVSGSGPNGPVRAAALQYDNKVVIAGEFTQVDGFAFARVARLHPTGIFDAGFNPGVGVNNTVHAVASGPDGKVYLGGDFNQVNNTNRTRIARLAADGQLDLTFSNSVSGAVRAIALQTNGQVIIGGDFTTVGGVPRNRLARLNSNGSLDDTFNPNVNGTVSAIVVQPDGRILIGGSFTLVGNTNRPSLSRLMPSGAIDQSFITGAGFNAAVNAIALQENGRILVGGLFSTYNGTPRSALVRLLPEGVLDPSFSIGAGANGAVNTISVAGSGKIFIGGDFTSYNGVIVNRIARLRENGALDLLFIAGAGANATVRTSVAQPDSAAVIGGDFTVVHGIARNYVARIHGDEKSNLAVVELANLSVNEDAGTASITLIRSGNTNTSFTLDWATYDITATNGFDYVGVTNTATFEAGQTSLVMNVTIIDDLLLEGDETFGLLLTASLSSVDLSSVANAIIKILDNEKAVQFASANYLGNEGGTNAAVVLERLGGLAGEVSVTLVTADGTATGNADYTPVSTPVTFADGQSSVTVLVPMLDDFIGEQAETVLLSLTTPIGAELGDRINATLTIVDDDFSIGVTVRSNTAPITILDAQPANPYPSTIAVSNLTGVVSRVQVQLVGLRHTFPSDIDVLLVGPGGQSLVLMSDAGGGLPVTNLTLTFDQDAATPLPLSTALTTGTNRPSDYPPADNFMAPAPVGPYGNAFTPFVGTMANGTWSLYVLDDRGGDTGVISNGWRLIITTVDLNKVADLAVEGSMSPPSAASGEVVLYSFIVSNAGPNAATEVILSNVPPIGAVVTSAFTSQGECTLTNGAVMCDLDFLAVGQTATVEMKVIHGLGGNTTNIAVVTASEPDVSISNNVARVVSNIVPGTTADLLVTITDSPDPVLQGQNIIYTITVSNRGPLTATGVVLTEYLPENGNFVTASVTQGTLSNAGPTLVFNLGTLTFGATATATVHIQPRSGGLITNSATATANEEDLTDNFVSEVTSVSPAANLVLSMGDSSDPVGANQTFGYNLVIYNAGPGVAQNVTVFDLLPAQVNFIASSSSQGTSIVSGGAVIMELGTIASGSSATATILGKATAAGTYTNFATVLSTQEDPDQANNSASETTQVFPVLVGGTNGGIQITRTTNAAQLAALVTGSGNTGIRVTSTDLRAHQLGANGPASSGIYTLSSVPSTYGLQAAGIVLSSGDVLDYESGPNGLSSTTTSYGNRATTAQEALLDPITGGGINNFTHFDVTQLDIVFDMLPGFSQVQFKVVFGSEEYPEFQNLGVNDGFGIFLNGQNISFVNGQPVSIDHPDFRNVRGTELDGVLAPGGVAVLNFVASVEPGSSNNTLTFIISDTSDSVLDTTAYITSLEGGLAPNADLTVQATASADPVRIGSNFTYRITVTNLGPDTATNTVVTDVLPAGLTFNSATTSQGSYSVTNGVVTFNLGTMFRFIGATMTIDVTPQLAGRYTNSVSVVSDLADLKGTNNAAVVVTTITDPGAFASTPVLLFGDAGPALTYPSVLNVSGYEALVGKVTVTLNNLSHSFPADLDVLVVGPQGQAVILMSDAGAGYDIADTTLRFDDFAAAELPGIGAIVPGVYRPTNIGDGDAFALPAPAGPHGTSLSIFNGTDPNGDWLLYIMDDQGSDTGALLGGWTLNFSADASVRLLVERTGQNAVLSWPASATGYSVLSATDPNGPWGPATGTLTTANGRFVFTVQTTAQRQFFRLVKP